MASEFSETVVNHFQDELCGYADAVYRFALGLTLSSEGAADCTKKTYAAVVSSMANFATHDREDSLFLLLKECWAQFQKEKGAHAAGQSKVVQALSGLDLDHRAALVAVDVVGLSAEDAGKAFGWNEDEARQHLAGARRALMQTSLAG